MAAESVPATEPEPVVNAAGQRAAGQRAAGLRAERALDAFASALRTARERRRLTQRELGRLAGVPQSHISKIESGAVDLRLSSLLALAAVLDLELVLTERAAPPQSGRGVAETLQMETPAAFGSIRVEPIEIVAPEPALLETRTR